MNNDPNGSRQLRDAVVVRTTRRAIDDLLTELVVRPLDEPASEQMRAVLEKAPAARAAMARLDTDAQTSAQPGGDVA